MNELIEKTITVLEASNKGSRELHLKTMIALGLAPEDAELSPSYIDEWDWRGQGKMVTDDDGIIDYPDDQRGRLTRYTTSLDATQHALPEGWEWIHTGQELPGSRGNATAYLRKDSNSFVGVSHDNIYIARTIVILKANLYQPQPELDLG